MSFDLGNVLGYAADATGFGEQFQMAEELFDAAAPLLQLAGAAAPLLAPICPPLALACGTLAAGAQVAQQAGIGNADEKAEQSAKSEEPVQTMAKSEEVQPRSAERRETSGRERSETVRERHRERPVSDHRTDSRTDDGRPVRDHRTSGDDRRERSVPVRRERSDNRFEIQPGDSFLLILAKALAGDIDKLQGEIEAEAKRGNGVADSGLISAKTQEMAGQVAIMNTTIGSLGKALETSAGQPA